MNSVFRKSACLWLALLLFCAASVLAAAPGSLDPTFGVGGMLEVDLAGPYEFAEVVTRLPDGRFVVAGGAYSDPRSDFALLRYFPDGTPDSSFGNNGVVLTDFDEDSDRIQALELLPDGRLMAAGPCQVDGVRRVGLARYLADGSLDPTFGLQGKLAGPAGWPVSLTVQPDGRLNVVIDDGVRFVIHRYLPDGGLDATYGSGGVVSIDVVFGWPEHAYASVLQPDGKLLIAGMVDTTPDQIALCRLLPNGNTDPNFGTSGKMVYSFGFPVDTRAYAVALLPDGSILAAGTAVFDNAHFAIMKTRGDGNLDTTFGQGGFAVTDFIAGADEAYHLQAQPDGRILALGRCAAVPGGTPTNFAIARYLPNGSLDPQFGSFGKVQTNFSNEARDEARDAFIDENARLTVVGRVASGSGAETIGIARYDLGNYSPVAVDDQVTTPEDTPVVLAGALEPLLNDTDANGDPIQRALLSQLGHGELIDTGGIWRYEPDPDYTGPDSFTYRVSDGADVSLPGTVRITVTPVNDPPVAQNDAYSTNEEAPLTINAPGVLSNDLDLEGSALTAALATPPAFGLATVSTTGRLTYAPNLNFSGTDSLQYQVSDGSAVSNLATVTITVLPANDAPVAPGQLVSVNEDVATGITLSASDPDGNALTYSLLTQPSHGSLSGTPPALTYLPALNYQGPDSFTYRASDGVLQSSTATVTITVSPVNDPPIAVNDSYNANEDQTLVVTAGSGVLANDTDPEGNSRTAVLEAGPAHGTLTLGLDGSFTYRAVLDYVGSDAFTYRASDGTAASGVATVSLTVLSGNDPPTAGALSVSVPEDDALVIMLAGNDPDGDALTYTILNPPSHGLLAGSGASQIYVPDTNYSGPDTFHYQVSDGLQSSGVAMVSILVTSIDDAPEAQNVAVTTDEDTAAAVVLLGSDAEGSSLQYQRLSEPSHGTLSGTAPNLSYAPALNYQGQDTFTYKVSAGMSDSNTAVVTITVRAVNDAPAVMPDSYPVQEDSLLSVPAPGVLANDSDPDGAPLTAVLLTGPAHGTLSLAGSGSFSYTPEPNYSGADNFTYRASDGTAQSNGVTVTITVNPANDPPSASSQSVTAPEDTARGITLAGTDPEGSALTYEVLTVPTHGTLSGTAPNLSYLPASNFQGADSFTFRVRDGALNSGPATVSITVTSVNDPPTANGQTVTTAEDTSRSITLTGSDAEGSSLTYEVVNEPIHGILSGSPPDVLYTPAADFSGADSFMFRVRDGVVNSVAATVAITVTAVNDPPTAASQSVTTAEDTACSITLSGSDPDEDVLTYEVTTAPAHGTLTGSPPQLSYLPTANFSGTDSLAFRVRDGALNSGTVTVPITVSAVNDPPAAAGQSITTPEDTSRSITLSGSDQEGDALTYEVVTGPAHGTLSGSPPTLSYTPTANYHGADTFQFRARDGALNSAAAAVTITVTPVSDAPVAAAQSIQTMEDQQKSVTLTGTDPDGDALTYQVVAAPTHGTLTGTAPNLMYSPDPNYTGPDELRFRVSDGTNQSPDATVQILVTGMDDPPSAGNDAYSTSLSTPLAVSAPGVLVNDVDLEGDSLTASLIAGPAQGTLALSSNGSFTYNPNVGFSGMDQFTYRAAGGGLQSPVATVTIQVGSTPPASTVGAQVKGSGTIGSGAARASFKVNATVSSTGQVKGTFTFTSAAVKIKKATFTGIRVTALAQGKEALVYGTVAISRTETQSLLLRFEDLGTAPGADRFALALGSGFATGTQSLVTGKLTVFSPP